MKQPATDAVVAWLREQGHDLQLFGPLVDGDTTEWAEASAAKYLAAEAAFRACERAVMTLGGMGYAAEYGVERLLREVLITRIAPVSPELIKCFIAERVLGLPKSY